MSRPTPSLTVLMCRDCCCGTTGKHPRVDHDGQLDAIEAAVGQRGDVTLQVVDCLDECDRSNVVVLRRSGLRTAERDTWLGGVLTDRATQALAGWITDGAEGPLPDAVAGLRFRHVPPHKR